MLLPMPWAEMEELARRTRATSLVLQRSVRNVIDKAQSGTLLPRKFWEEKVEIWIFS